MTSEQFKRIPHFTARLACLLMLCAGLIGCEAFFKPDPQRQVSPYTQRQVWAVAPLRNESGSRFAGGTKLADELTHQITLIRGLDAVPVNRVLTAMESLKMVEVRSRTDALKLRKALDVDGIIIGSASTWDPYDPPKIGLAVELYLDPVHPSRKLDTRRLTRAATQGQAIPDQPYKAEDQPVSAISAFYDAADPITREHLTDYAEDRGFANDDKHPVRLYRLSMDLYSQFASHRIIRRLLAAERSRLMPPPEIASE